MKGSSEEAVAMNLLVSVLGDQRHKYVLIKECGLFIDKYHTVFRCSPDGMVCSDCCECALLEANPLQRLFKELPYVLIWTYKHSYHLQKVLFDEAFCKNMTSNL